jgi:hypothetical protein
VPAQALLDGNIDLDAAPTLRVVGEVNSLGQPPF